VNESFRRKTRNLRRGKHKTALGFNKNEELEKVLKFRGEVNGEPKTFKGGRKTKRRCLWWSIKNVDQQKGEDERGVIRKTKAIPTAHTFTS